METKPIDFEIAMKELETVVSELDGEVKLERALTLFEQGMKLSKQCEEFLKGAEQKIEMLKRGEDGALVAIPVNADDVESLVATGTASRDSESTSKRKKTGAGESVIAEGKASSQLTMFDAGVK